MFRDSRILVLQADMQSTSCPASAGSLLAVDAPTSTPLELKLAVQDGAGEARLDNVWFSDARYRASSRAKYLF